MQETSRSYPIGDNENNLINPASKESQTGNKLGSELIRPLHSPVLILVQEPNPKLFQEDAQPQGLTNMSLNYPFTPEILKELNKIYYEPYFLVPGNMVPHKHTALDSLGNFEPAGTFGPFNVYRIIQQDKAGADRLMIFGSRKNASRAVAELAAGNIRYLQPEIDKKPKDKENPDRYFQGVKSKERTDMKRALETLLEKKFLQRLKDATIENYPKQMLDGLALVIDGLYKNTPKNEHGEISPEHDSSDWLKWIFAEKYLLPLKNYLEYQSSNSTGVSPNDLSEEIAETVIDYDYVIDTMRAQAALLIGEQEKPSHFGFLIPKDQINGVRSHGLSIILTSSHFVIKDGNNGWSYPLPYRTEHSEVAIKGGLARLMAKVALGLPVDGEIPPSDVDLVTFGDGISADVLKQKFNVEVRDIERLKSGDVNEFLGDRDQSMNEVLFTEKGLIMSLNALSAFFQSTSEASADPVRNIHGEHVFNLHRGYLSEGSNMADYFLVKGTRFPSPRALGRMYKFLIEGKTDSFTVPEGSLKMDIGAAHWLVMLRKFMNVPDQDRRNKLLERTILLAGRVKSPFFKDEFLTDENGPQRFIDSILEQYQQETGKQFDLQNILSDKETLDWIASRLVRQILHRFDSYFGYNKERSFVNKLDNKDFLPVQIVLPDEKDFQPGWSEDELPDYHPPERNYDWRNIDIESILSNPKYQKLFARHMQRNEELIKGSDLNDADYYKLNERINHEDEEDENLHLTSDLERREYNHWFTKYAYLEGARDGLDNGLYPILYQFSRLPFSSRSSCTGHIIEGTNEIEEDWFPALNFIAYPDITKEERDAQWQFIRDLHQLNQNICFRLGVVPYNILQLKGDILEFKDGHKEELSVAEAFERGKELWLYINIYHDRLKYAYGRETLTAIWDEFYKYVNQKLGVNTSSRDLSAENLFSKNTSVNKSRFAIS